MTYCIACGIDLKGHFILCGPHYAEFKDRLHEPWYKAANAEASRERRSNKKYNDMVVVSLEEMEEVMGKDRV